MYVAPRVCCNLREEFADDKLKRGIPFDIKC